jgi:pimeloyl-ACP methyl ester carboxylesterase
MGHSMGGAIAQVVALNSPDRVDGLVLLGTGAKLGVAPQLLQGLEEDFEGAVDLIAEWAWGPSADPELVGAGRRVMLETGPETLLKDFLACDRFDIRDRVQEIAVPAAVLTGSEDLMTPARFGKWLADRIPDARFHLVEGAGHMLMLEQPREVARVIRDFVSEIT